MTIFDLSNASNFALKASINQPSNKAVKAGSSQSRTGMNDATKAVNGNIKVAQIELLNPISVGGFIFLLAWPSPNLDHEGERTAKANTILNKTPAGKKVSISINNLIKSGEHGRVSIGRSLRAAIADQAITVKEAESELKKMFPKGVNARGIQKAVDDFNIFLGKKFKYNS